MRYSTWIILFFNVLENGLFNTMFNAVVDENKETCIADIFFVHSIKQ